MRVRFNSEAEFLEELRADPPIDEIVRVTKLFQPSSQGSITFVFGVATYVNRRGQLVEFKHFCGQHWGDGFDVSTDTERRSEALAARLAEAATAQGLTVRAGLLEEREGAS